MIARLLALFGYRLVRIADDTINREEREAAGCMIALLAARVRGINPFLPNSVPAAYQQHAARFLASVGLDARGVRKVDDV